MPSSRDVLLDKFLAEAGTHKLVLARNNYIGQIGCPTSHIDHVYHAGDIRTAMTDIDTYTYLLLFAHFAILPGFPHG